MPIETRLRSHLQGPGPYLARITNLLDPTYTGSVEVAIEKGFVANTKIQSQTYIVQYLSPFYGVTGIQYEGNNPDNFNDVQKSYGMWMIPPDIGTKVLVIFIDGDPNQGYWIGCVADKFQNHMIPGIAASKQVGMSAADERKYGTNRLPVAEFLKGAANPDMPLNPDSRKKPIHPFADRLLEQGLLRDTVRGVTSSSARREVPSMVFGISTPGPLDPNGKKGAVGYETIASVPVSRLGGSQFVMDDGDQDGQNELVRLRTRTGHQILMHNSSDLIYIANSKGTAWIELTSNGKIDIFAKDSVSIHSENDFNFRADRDINFEAGRNINVSALSGIEVNAVDKFYLVCDKEGKLEFGSNFSILAGADMKVRADAMASFISGADMRLTASTQMNILSGADTRVTAGPNIHLNGPSASAAVNPTATAKLPLVSLPNTSIASGWGPDVYYKTDDLVSIMKRVPVHEPWEHHESLNPQDFDVDATDTGTTSTQISTAGKPVSVTYNKAPDLSGTPPEPTGNKEEDNVAAFLWMIRKCEGTSAPNGYQVMFTGKLFPIDDPLLRTYQFKDHPRIANVGGGLTSTAAGAYQFLSSTWDGCKKTLGLSDFSPASQDKACILLLKNRKAYEDVKAGRFEAAVIKCNKEWASLPGSPYDQNPKPMGTALAYYKQGGGTVA